MGAGLDIFYFCRFKSNDVYFMKKYNVEVNCRF